jgi:small nuclear ribonucleoprotein
MLYKIDAREFGNLFKLANSLYEGGEESLPRAQEKPKLNLESPLKYLRAAVNNVVLVKLKDGSEYIGKLVFTDNTMNLILDDCEELSPETGEPIAKYGRIMIRGSYVLFVSLDYHKVMK